jgi:uncharacterized coiled-coil DUF342 family protein|tara:strand:- start:886 stop:1134 length:249 start_codon:yes stop_codon:yes gene_type:complete
MDEIEEMVKNVNETLDALRQAREQLTETFEMATQFRADFDELMQAIYWFSLTPEGQDTVSPQMNHLKAVYQKMHEKWDSIQD